LRDLNYSYGHIQEVIIQNFIPKPATGMANSSECDPEEHLWTIAAARLIFENLTIFRRHPISLVQSKIWVRAGVDDFGGISPVTIDFINPEKPWPHLKELSDTILQFGKKLKARAAIYPEYIAKPGFLAEHLRGFVDAVTDDKGYLKNDPLKSNDNNNFVDLNEQKAIDLAEMERVESPAIKKKRISADQIFLSQNLDNNCRFMNSKSQQSIAGVGNAIVDVLCNIEDNTLEKLQLQKGSMKLCSAEFQNRILNETSNCEISPGGSVANSIATLSLLGINTNFSATIGEDIWEILLSNLFRLCIDLNIEIHPDLPDWKKYPSNYSRW
jgi:hypothetical protein